MQTLLDLAETYNIYHTKIYKGSAKSEVFIYIYKYCTIPSTPRGPSRHTYGIHFKILHRLPGGVTSLTCQPFNSLGVKIIIIIQHEIWFQTLMHLNECFNKGMHFGWKTPKISHTSFAALSVKSVLTTPKRNQCIVFGIWIESQET